MDLEGPLTFGKVSTTSNTTLRFPGDLDEVGIFDYVLTVDEINDLKNGDGCLRVADDLGIWVPCAEYSGAQYGFTLNFYSNLDDPSGLYWKLDMSTLTDGTGTDCIPIGSDLSMPIPCAAYNATQYGFTLRFYNNPNDLSGLYWKLDASTLEMR